MLDTRDNQIVIKGWLATNLIPYNSFVTPSTWVFV